MFQKSTTIAFTFLLFASLLAAETGTKGNKEYIHPKERFSFVYPEKWVLDATNKNVSVVVLSPDKKALVSVNTQSPLSGKKACEVLKDFEKLNTAINFNLIPEDKQRATADELRFVRATDSCIGVYKFVTKDIEFLQGVVVYVRGSKAWFVTQLVVVSAQSEYADIVGNIAKSFRLR